MTKRSESKAAKKAGADVVPLKGRRCPLCGKPAVARYRPFCSARCADLDLGRWINEDYRVASTEAAEEEAAEDEASEADGAGGAEED